MQNLGWEEEWTSHFEEIKVAQMGLAGKRYWTHLYCGKSLGFWHTLDSLMQSFCAPPQKKKKFSKHKAPWVAQHTPCFDFLLTQMSLLISRYLPTYGCTDRQKHQSKHLSGKNNTRCTFNTTSWQVGLYGMPTWQTCLTWCPFTNTLKVWTRVSKWGTFRARCACGWSPTITNIVFKVDF